MRKETLEKIFEKDFQKIVFKGCITGDQVVYKKQETTLEDDCVVINFGSTKRYIDISSIEFVDIISSNDFIKDF